MAPSHEIFVTIENILKSPLTLTALGIAISSFVLYYVFVVKANKSKSAKSVRSKNLSKPAAAAANKQKQTTTTKKSSEAKKVNSTSKQSSVAKSTSDKSKKEQQASGKQNVQQAKKNKETDAKKKEAAKKLEAEQNKKQQVTQLERKIKVAEANPRLNDKTQTKDEGGWIKLVSRKEKRERSAKLKELRAEQQGTEQTKQTEPKPLSERKPYRGNRLEAVVGNNKRDTPISKRTTNN